MWCGVKGAGWLRALTLGSGAQVAQPCMFQPHIRATGTWTPLFLLAPKSYDFLAVLCPQAWSWACAQLALLAYPLSPV